MQMVVPGKERREWAQAERSLLLIWCSAVSRVLLAMRAQGLQQSGGEARNGVDRAVHERELCCLVGERPCYHA